MKLSPMMEQYMGIKNQYPDCVLFYRLGDFYELFFDDALEISKVLELTLTSRNCGLEEKAPMCGVPFHSATSYISKLVSKGYKVAICEQTEDPALAKGIVNREVVRIVTPGTNIISDDFDVLENHYLSAFYFSGKALELAYVDVATGEFSATYTPCDGSYSEKSLEDMLNEIAKLRVSEIIANDGLETLISKEALANFSGAYITLKPDSYFATSAGRDIIKAHFDITNLSALGIREEDGSIEAIGGLLSYLRETQKYKMDHITRIKEYLLGSNMALDNATLRNLELTETLYDKEAKGSLLYILDKTRTAHGSRLMKQWIREPLNQTSSINERLDAVEELFNNQLLLSDLRQQLDTIYDFQRITGKVASGTLNPRDLIALKKSLLSIPKIKNIVESTKADYLIKLKSDLHNFDNISERIEKAIEEDPPMTLRDGGVIKAGYSHKLDELNNSIKDGREWIAALESTERERTGIKNLKVGFNKIFGYYIDINKSQIDKVPDDYIRKQTLVNNERYITPKMKEVESTVLNGQEKINKLEYELFDELRKSIIPAISKLQETALAIATLDVLSSLAYVASKNNYTKPIVDDREILHIEKGRHPVIEKMEEGILFVPNDTHLSRDENFMAIITGPNMAGKSTYMRQTALIVLMAQMGSFVPAAKAHIGTVDRIFTRIGASDNLSQGKSTFFVEMSELAYILSSATPKSLVILDEIGRGTSTYDGMSIAYATVNYLCKSNRRVRTMFATHYHELTVLPERIPGAFNLNVDVLEEGGEIVFLHRIVEGAASQSYGIHVAKLAGVPKELLKNAETKLYELENNPCNDSQYSKNNNSFNTYSEHNEEVLDNAGEVLDNVREIQLSLFHSPNLQLEDAFIERIKALDLNDVKASEAFQILEELKDIIDEN